MRQTLAFDNTLEHWKTRYSYTPSCMMHLNKLFFSSPMMKDESDKKKIFYRHNDSSESVNTFYNSSDHSSPSALAVSFNGFTAKSLRSPASNTSSSNKLFKSFSISGLNGATSVTGLSLGASSFIVNNQDSPSSSAEGLHKLTPLRRMGNSVYGEVGKDANMSGMNIKVIGKIKNVFKHAFYDDGLNYWYIMTPGDQLVDGAPIGQTVVTSNEFPQLEGLLVDEDGFDAEPTFDGLGHNLYAFEMESFTSANPLPSSVLHEVGHPLQPGINAQANYGQYVRFFSGRVNEDGTMVATPYVAVGEYGPTGAQYQVNFTESENFEGGPSFSRYLSYGDPYSDENNAFKKGKFLLLATGVLGEIPHLQYEFTPGCPVDGFYSDNTGGWDPGLDDIQDLVAKGREYLYCMTPGEINGSDAHGSFADAFVVLGNSQFEVSSLQVEFEFTEYDHGGIAGTASKAKTKK